MGKHHQKCNETEEHVLTRVCLEERTYVDDRNGEAGGSENVLFDRSPRLLLLRFSWFLHLMLSPGYGLFSTVSRMKPAWPATQPAGDRDQMGPEQVHTMAILHETEWLLGSGGLRIYCSRVNKADTWTAHQEAGPFSSSN